MQEKGGCGLNLNNSVVESCFSVSLKTSFEIMLCFLFPFPLLGPHFVTFSCHLAFWLLSTLPNTRDTRNLTIRPSSSLLTLIFKISVWFSSDISHVFHSIFYSRTHRSHGDPNILVIDDGALTVREWVSEKMFFFYSLFYTEAYDSTL